MAKPGDFELRASNILDRDTLFRLYVEEKLPEYKVAERLGVSRWTIGQNLLHHGIHRRDQAEANVLRFRTNPAERKKYARIAREQFTGTRQSVETMRRKAHTVWRNQSQRSWYERRVRDGLRVLDIPAESLYPLERWNIDVAVPIARLAIEIHGGWHWSAKKRDQDARKAALLAERDWTLLTFARNSFSSASRPSRREFVQMIVDEAADTYHEITGSQVAS